MNPTINRVVHADCIRALPCLPSECIDFVLTDPPYLANYRSSDGRTVPNDDNSAWLIPAFKQIFRVLKPDSYCVSFYGWPNADLFLRAFRLAGFRPVGHLVFPKTYNSQKRNTAATFHLGYRHECAYLLAKGRPKPQAFIPDVLPWSYTGNQLHPTQKPLSILKPMVEAFSPTGGIVLDPFAGSGSSLVAAKQLSRSYVGFELDSDYHAIASKRLMGTG